MEQRKLLLDLAVSFYTHTKEVIGSTNVKVCVTVAGCSGTVRTFFSVLQLSAWMDGLQKQLSSDLSVSQDSVEALQTLINQQQQQQANTQVPAHL